MRSMLAAVGRGQLRYFDEKVAWHRENRRCYEERPGALPGVSFPADREDAASNAWLTVRTIDPAVAGIDHEMLRLRLRCDPGDATLTRGNAYCDRRSVTIRCTVVGASSLDHQGSSQFSDKGA